MNLRQSLDDMNCPAPQDASFALGWLDDAAKTEFENVLAADPSSVARLRRTEDLIAQLGTQGKASAAPASILAGAKVRLKIQLPALAEPSRIRRLMAHPAWGWAAAAVIVLSTLVWHISQGERKPALSGTSHKPNPNRGAASEQVVAGDPLPPAGDQPLPEGTVALPAASGTGMNPKAGPAVGPRGFHGSLPQDMLQPAAQVARPQKSPVPLLSAGSLSRMVVVALGPPDAPQPMELSTRETLADRVAAAVVNAPELGASMSLAPDLAASSEATTEPDPAAALNDPVFETELPSNSPREGRAHDPAGKVPDAAVSAPAAWAIFDETSGQGSIIVSSLPDLPADETYQLWLIDPAQPAPLSVGLLPTLVGGSGQIRFQFSQPDIAPQDFQLTREPSGGSAKPGSQVILQRH